MMVLAAFAVAAVFTASYDADFRGEVGGETVKADYSGGVLWEDIEAHLKPGLSGRSVSIGTPETKASALYSVYRNTGFLRPEEGGISFWVLPVDWTGDDGRYHVFLRAEGPDADLLVYKTSSNVLTVYSSFRRKKESSGVSCSIRDWKRGQWHHIAVEWKGGLARLFVDGSIRASGEFLRPGSGYDRIGVGGLRPLAWQNPMNFSQIDELRISSEPAATAAEQKKLMEEQNAALAKRFSMPNPKAYCGQSGIAESREDYWYHDVMLGINRAVDWVCAREDVDLTQITYTGSSQGGGFGLFLNYLNGHFTKAFVAVCAITGHYGYKQGRQSGWPGLVMSQAKENREAAARNAAYFDGVYFAARIRHPIRFIVGFADTTCPPADVYAAYNVCPSKDKAIVNAIGSGHNWYGWYGKHKGKDCIDFDAWLRTK